MNERFADALGRVVDPDLAGPELLPVRLAQACAAILSVDGVSVSVIQGAQMRYPIGASNAEATTAERLQFTVGEGPCLAARTSQQVVRADEQMLATRWPQFHRRLLEATSYRSVMSLPLEGMLGDGGAMDLYLRDPDPSRIGMADAKAIAVEFAAGLGAQRWTDRMDGPIWLDTDAMLARGLVSVAIGMITITADVDFPDALALLRGRAYSSGQSVDQVAAAVVSRSLPASALHPDQDP